MPLHRLLDFFLRGAWFQFEGTVERGLAAGGIPLGPAPLRVAEAFEDTRAPDDRLAELEDETVENNLHLTIHKKAALASVEAPSTR